MLVVGWVLQAFQWVAFGYIVVIGTVVLHLLLPHAANAPGSNHGASFARSTAACASPAHRPEAEQ